MSSGPGQPPQYSQSNTASNGGSIYANQGTGNQIINNGPVRKRGPRADTKILLFMIVANVGFFFYGKDSYTGTNSTGDDWRAGIAIVLFIVTCSMIGRWIRRRM